MLGFNFREVLFRLAVADSEVAFLGEEVEVGQYIDLQTRRALTVVSRLGEDVVDFKSAHLSQHPLFQRVTCASVLRVSHAGRSGKSLTLEDSYYPAVRVARKAQKSR